jgi:dienelactone hydrolase
MSACSISSDRIDYTDGETSFEAYVATPQERKGQRPCVLLAHEWSGLNEGMKRIADRLAKLGYVCFAMDVYGKGIRGDQRGDNAHLMAPLMANRGMLRRRLLAGLNAALRHPAVDPNHVAVMGYCFGGLCALDLARAAPQQLLAAISFHGVLEPPNLGVQGPINASILLLHGWEDPMAPPHDVLAITKEFSDAGADWQLHAYGHAMHAFTFEGVNLPERGLAHNPAADRRSWRAMRAFLKETFSEAQMDLAT